MDLAEATRQYQIAREHYARGEREFEGVLSMEDELAVMKTELDLARKAMEIAWLGHIGIHDPSTSTP